MSNPNQQLAANVVIEIGVKLPPVPKSLALNTPGVESRIRLGDLPATEVAHIANEWKKAFIAEAKEQRNVHKD